MKGIKENILSLMAGIIIGIVFKVFEFPLPAPPNISGFMGIFGVWLGASIIKRIESKDEVIKE